MNSSPSGGCSSVTPEISIQNYGLNNLTSVQVDVFLNGVQQSSNIYNQVWSNVLNTYVALNLNTLEILELQLNEVVGLVNNDLITIEVSMPNGVADTDPQNNQTISYLVDLGFDNAYWLSLIHI